MPYIDHLFVAAFLAFGWGLSLATYRVFAVRHGWPMGELHDAKPLVPMLIGAFAVVIAFLFAAARLYDAGGWWVVVAGIAFAAVWTGFMRVGSQISLLLAPLATLFLVMAWISVRTPPDDVVGTRFPPAGATTATTARPVVASTPAARVR
ncbi:MAG TPA: hypothetical protein VMX97_17780 [Hyphomicrobiaceae bacterium]|nr:hypothetical protein [Hyphomicrobiaceae bacterium]